MADTLTVNLNLTLIEIGASDNTWGTKLNANFAALDTAVFDKLDKSGGALTGGISFGSVVAPGGAADVSRHLALFGTTFGINVIGTGMNFVGGAAANFFFNQGTTEIARVSPGGTAIPSVNTIITREKGDFRYQPFPSLSAVNTELTFPIGTILLISNQVADNNSSVVIYRQSSSQYTITPTGSALTGTWRARGSFDGVSKFMLVQRTA